MQPARPPHLVFVGELSWLCQKGVGVLVGTPLHQQRALLLKKAHGITGCMERLSDCRLRGIILPSAQHWCDHARSTAVGGHTKV